MPPDSKSRIVVRLSGFESPPSPPCSLIVCFVRLNVESLPAFRQFLRPMPPEIAAISAKVLARKAALSLASSTQEVPFFQKSFFEGSNSPPSAAQSSIAYFVYDFYIESSGHSRISTRSPPTGKLSSTAIRPGKHNSLTQRSEVRFPKEAPQRIRLPLRLPSPSRFCFWLRDNSKAITQLDSLLVRDQGVGGSNPLSPTNFFNNLQTHHILESRPSGISPGGLVPVDASILGFSPNLGCNTIYKNIYRRKR